MNSYQKKKKNMRVHSNDGCVIVVCHLKSSKEIPENRWMMKISH